MAPGTRLGPYEIIALLGEGGMGQVYRARDPRLARDVAIKILPEAFVADPERAARFAREAQTLAALNHPNIAGIYGLEESSGVQAIVLELVDGPTLSDRLATGPMPVSEALDVARQLAEALEAAHERGIIHRDLKPANIQIGPADVVKVLDFGLATMSQGSGTQNVDATNSPTNTAIATRAGVIMGTAAYMAPEQASGKPVDKRADIWAFGVVLWEMLTGANPFRGESIAHSLASVMTTEPDWSGLPADTPAPIRRLLRRALEKDRKRRLTDAGSARLEIDEALATPTAGTGAAASVLVAAPSRAAWRVALPWALAAIFGAGFVSTLVMRAPWRRTETGPVVRLTTDVDADTTLSASAAPLGNLALSPNGNLLAFSAQNSAGTSQLYIRRLEQLQAIALMGTEDARSPFFSPDGQWIGFFARTSMKKVSITGGAAITICTAGAGRGATWGDDGTIVFSPSGAPGARLMRVPASGGTPANLTTTADGTTERWPQLLPGGKAVMFTAAAVSSNFDGANVVVQLLASGPPKIVQRGAIYGRYVPSGHLLYVHGGTLFAASFDLDRLEMAGDPVPVAEGVNASEGTGVANFSVAQNGTLVYLSGQTAEEESPVVWMDRSGQTTPLRAMPSAWSSPRFSPDGTKLAMEIATTGIPAIWVYDWSRDTTTRVTTGLASSKPIWTPDGRRLVFSSPRDGGSLNLFWQQADGTGDAQRLTTGPSPQYLGSWHPDGRTLAFTEVNPHTDADIMIMTVGGDDASGWKPGKPTPFLNTPSAEQDPQFSPDGRWIAYSSAESGRQEIYVRPFPSAPGKWQVSGGSGGGRWPVWSRTRPELLYSTLDQQLMVASYGTEGGSFHASKPQLWSSGRFTVRPGQSSYDLHPDGKRFALASPRATAANQDKFVFVFNFFEELLRLAPPKR